MRTIWKFRLQLKDSQFIQMPKGANILCLQTQGREPHIWAEVDDQQTVKETRCFDTFGTGHLMPDNYTGKYIGTYQSHGGYSCTMSTKLKNKFGWYYKRYYLY